MVYADDIPVAHTPGCGWEEFSRARVGDLHRAVSRGCTDGEDLARLFGGNQHLGRVERIEQCGNRVVITGGEDHDMRRTAPWKMASTMFPVSAAMRSALRRVHR